MKIKNKAVILAAATLGLVGTVAVSVNAAVENDIPFGFHIKVLNQNTRVSKPEPRQTTRTDRTWAVDMQYSGEGSNSALTRFWLEVKNGTNVSPSFLTSVNTRRLYEKAYKETSPASVYLTAENNNTNFNSYKVSGVWDEESAFLMKKDGSVYYQQKD